MINNRLLHHAARPSGRGGFTLVELLVVIGIIAILAGVALGPITNGIKKAKQSAGMQTTHTIALSEFQFANDNSTNQGSYPDKNYVNGGGTGHADDVANCLISGNYITDNSIFVISGSGATKPAVGAKPTKANVSFDFAGALDGNGINSNTPDQMPIVWSSTGGDPGLKTATGAVILTPALGTAFPFGQQGIAVCYKSNSAKFLVVKNDGTYKAAIADATYPGWANYNYLDGTP